MISPACYFYGHDEEEEKITKKWVIRMMILDPVGAIFGDYVLPNLRTMRFSSLKEHRK